VAEDGVVGQAGALQREVAERECEERPRRYDYEREHHAIHARDADATKEIAPGWVKHRRKKRRCAEDYPRDLQNPRIGEGERQHQGDKGSQCHQLTRNVPQRRAELHDHPDYGRSEEEREGQVVDTVVWVPEMLTDMAARCPPEQRSEKLGLQHDQTEERSQPNGEQHDE